MAVNYNDPRFTKVEKQEAEAIKNVNNTYNEMINSSNKFYQDQINASKDYANTQKEQQQAQTDFTIEKVNQAKEQVNKQYVKEQKGAYTDYQKATNQYGANAEALASQGLNQTGYSESTRTNAYNTYQNRYMTARESYNQAILNYDNSIKEAQLANSAALAQIAYQALQKQLELGLQGFQYKNQLILQKLTAVNQEKDRYYQRYQNVLQQINTENALAEQVRQFNAKMALEREQFAWTKAQASRSGRSGGSADDDSGSAPLVDGNNNAPINQTKPQEGKLSQAGNKHYKTALTIYNSRTGSKEQSARFTANYLYDAYNRGGLKESDLRIITKKLGLD